jgi:endonuclease YncB( thermonuclease family)
MNRTTAILAGAILLGTGAAFAIPDATGLEGNPRVVDGDTLAFGSIKVRIWGIDAFESSQTCQQPAGTYACGQAATAAMQNIIGGQYVRCVQHGHETSYDRIVAQCFVGSTRWGEASTTDIGRALVLRGWAFDYTRYSKGYYKDAQEGARVAGTGAWAGSFQWPWDYRHHGR